MDTTNTPQRLGMHTPVTMLDGSGPAYASPQCGIRHGAWDGVRYVVHQENKTTGGWREDLDMRLGLHFEVAAPAQASEYVSAMADMFGMGDLAASLERLATGR